jgi:hypothetical protein
VTSAAFIVGVPLQPTPPIAVAGPVPGSADLSISVAPIASGVVTVLVAGNPFAPFVQQLPQQETLVALGAVQVSTAYNALVLGIDNILLNAATTLSSQTELTASYATISTLINALATQVTALEGLSSAFFAGAFANELMLVQFHTALVPNVATLNSALNVLAAYLRDNDLINITPPAESQLTPFNLAYVKIGAPNNLGAMQMQASNPAGDIDIQDITSSGGAFLAQLSTLQGTAFVSEADSINKVNALLQVQVAAITAALNSYLASVPALGLTVQSNSNLITNFPQLLSVFGAVLTYLRNLGTLPT